VSALLERLVQMCPPGSYAGEQVDWDSLEESLGFALPDDYKELTSHYPPGLFGDFLTVIYPVSQISTIDLRSQIEASRLTFRILKRAGDEIPCDEALLIPVCGTDNGNRVFWVRDPLGDPNRWTLLVNEPRGPQWVKFEGGILQFLVEILSGSTKIEVFPEDYPWGRPKFASIWG